MILVAAPATDNKVVLYCVHTPYTPGNTALGVTMKRPGMSAATMTPREYDDVTLVYVMMSRVDTVDHSCPTVLPELWTAVWISWASVAVAGLEGFNTTPSVRQHLEKKERKKERIIIMNT